MYRKVNFRWNLKSYLGITQGAFLSSSGIVSVLTADHHHDLSQTALETTLSFKSRLAWGNEGAVTRFD